MNKLVPESFMPQEDQGYFTVELELPEGATIERTRTVTDRAMAFLMQDPDVEYVLNVTVRVLVWAATRPAATDSDPQVLEGAGIGGYQRSDETCA